ncbi:MAG: class I SAM-dependent methyltransferase family protein [Candidatus Omnitrophica bacterium]|nr:class I SAM-dependent methyltransferase family protein [Candidatus Omnitrophota bacterium]
MNNLKFLLAKIFMKTIGQTSDGIHLCYQEGLTSGKMLDYVYRNQASGCLILGKSIDKVFLSDPGWEAVRTRRENLETLLIQSITSLRKENKPISLVDIASGPAEYIFSVLQKVEGNDLKVLCQDYEARWVEEGKKKAEERNIKNIRFQQGDAFDREALLRIKPRPNIIVASGFYDWFTDDGKIIESIKIIFDMLEPGGYFVLSNQMAHPKLNFTQAVFTDFHHQPLQMTMRSKEKISHWLEEIGFSIDRVLVDDHGYYSVLKVSKPKE